MLRGFSLTRRPAPRQPRLPAAPRLLDGAFGIGGPPVVLLFFADAGRRQRWGASQSSRFLSTDVLGLIDRTP